MSEVKGEDPEVVAVLDTLAAGNGEEPYSNAVERRVKNRHPSTDPGGPPPKPKRPRAPKRKQLTVRVSPELQDRIEAECPDKMGDNEWLATLLERGLTPMLTIEGPTEADIERMRREWEAAPPVIIPNDSRERYYREARDIVDGCINALVLQTGDRIDTRGPNGLRARVDKALLENRA